MNKTSSKIIELDEVIENRMNQSGTNKSQPGPTCPNWGKPGQPVELGQLGQLEQPGEAGATKVSRDN
jgi:hypothetical protein